MGEIPRLGSGYDTFGGGVKSTLLEIVSQDDQGPPIFDADYHICTTTEEVMDKLKISASLEGGGAWGSMSAKMDFAKSLCESSTSITALIVIDKVVKQVTAHEVSFKEAPRDAATMYKQGGDSYVTYVKYGAQYIGAYTSMTESFETKMEIKAALNASIAAVNLKSDFKTAIENVNKSKNTSFKFTQHAVGWPNAKLPTQETLGSFYNEFNITTINNPDVLEIKTRQYEDVKGCPDMDPLKSAYELYTRDMRGKHAYSTVERQARKTKAAIETVRAVYSFYCQAEVETGWDHRLRSLQDILNNIGDWKRDVQRNPTSNPRELNLDERSLELPVPRYSFYYPGSAGDSKQGDPWDDLTLKQVMECVYPRSIQVRSAGLIDKLITVYGYEDPERDAFERVHGGNGGTLGEKFMLTPQNRISRVDVWDEPSPYWQWSVKVTGIKIRIQGSTQEKEFGPRTGTHHPQVRQNEKWCFIGWSGRSNGALDYLKAVYIGFDPPLWKMPALPDK